MIFFEELNLKVLAKECWKVVWMQGGSFLNILGWVAFKRGVYFAKVDLVAQVFVLCVILMVKIWVCECMSVVWISYWSWRCQ